MRMQCVSTTVEPGTRNTSPRIRFAVLRPTPGSAVSSSIVRGSSPPYFVSNTCAQATMSRALARKKPQEWTYCSTSATSASAKLSSVGKRSNSAGVIWLTRSSVHCAASRTESSSS